VANLVPECATETCKAEANGHIEITDVCVGPGGTTWVATWSLDTNRPGGDLVRSLLVHTIGTSPTVLARASAPEPYFGDECRGCRDSPLFTMKAHIAGESIVGVVARAGDPQLQVVVDAQMTPVSEISAPAEVWSLWGSGYHFRPYDQGWRWFWRASDTTPDSEVTMGESPLIRVATGEGDAARVVFWYPTATGLKQAAAFTMPELGERQKVVLEGNVSPELQALLLASERRGLEPKDEAGCAEMLGLLHP